MNYLFLLKKAFFDAFNEEFPNFNHNELNILSILNFEVPNDKKYGDISSNLAMLLGKHLKMSPITIAKKICNSLQKYYIKIKQATYVTPGFINIIFTDEFWTDILKIINETSYDDYCISKFGDNQRINIEFVSANPTGPLHIGHARGAIYGDVLANILEQCSYEVVREFYINDAGKQIDILIESLWIRYQQICGKEVELPEKCYPGEYLIEAAEYLKDQYKDIENYILCNIKNKSEKEENYNNIKNKLLRDFILNKMLNDIKSDLAEIDVYHDVFISETDDISENISKTIDILQEKNLLYKGVLEKPKGESDEDWEPREQLLFKSSMFGDSSDRAICKSDGTQTYFLSDIAYHNHKYQRNFSKMLVVMGADHIGYISRLKAAVSAISDNKIIFEVIITELVNLFKNGKKIKMSKRAGTFVTLRDVVDELGKDILRFSMLWRKSDTQFDLDFAKAKEMSKDNPIFYIQYAHTRIFSTIRRAVDDGYCDNDEFIIQSFEENIKPYKDKINNEYITTDTSNIQKIKSNKKIYQKYYFYPRKNINYTLINNFAKDLIHKIAQFQQIIEKSAITLEPHRLSYYLYNLASEIHILWNLGVNNSEMRFITDNKELTRARISILFAAAKTLGKGLQIMGIKALTIM